MYKALFLILALCWPMGPAPWAADLVSFWASPQRGGNSFNRLPPREPISMPWRPRATWVRVAYDKWAGEGRDFLVGDADRYDGLVTRDLATLAGVLDRADRAGLKVVIAPLSLPLMCWARNNAGEFDDQLWGTRATGRSLRRSGANWPRHCAIIRRWPPTTW